MTRTVFGLLLAGIGALPGTIQAQFSGPAGPPPGADASYPRAPSIPAIGVRNTTYLSVPSSALGPSVDPAKGYRLQGLGQGLYMITDNIYQTMFLVYDQGVVVIDAPPNYAPAFRRRLRK